jgi:SAM-dependent methyltransferase
MNSNKNKYWDEEMLRNAANYRLNTLVSNYARKICYSHFILKMKPSENTTIVDIGTTSEITLEANYLEKIYPFKKNINCCSLSDGVKIINAYPGVRHVKVESTKLPFNSKQFDICYSNALLEHVGDSNSQKQLFNEMIRIAKRVYMMVLNRYFPIEHHTSLPFIHWLPKRIFRKILPKIGQNFYSEEKNLNRISKSQLSMWTEKSKEFVVETIGIGFGMFKWNLVIYKP